MFPKLCKTVNVISHSSEFSVYLTFKTNDLFNVIQRKMKLHLLKYLVNFTAWMNGIPWMGLFEMTVGKRRAYTIIFFNKNDSLEFLEQWLTNSSGNVCSMLIPGPESLIPLAEDRDSEIMVLSTLQEMLPYSKCFPTFRLWDLPRVFNQVVGMLRKTGGQTKSVHSSKSRLIITSFIYKASTVHFIWGKKRKKVLVEKCLKTSAFKKEI